MFTQDEKLVLGIISGSFPQPRIGFSKENLEKILKNHRCYPLLYSRLQNFENQTSVLAIPDDLKFEYIRNLRGQLFQKKSALRLIDYFNRENIPLVILKSPFLSERIYGDEGARNFGCDVDILVREDDFKAVEKIFLDLGYIVREYKNPWPRDRVHEIHNDSSDKPNIDLHFRPMYSEAFPDLNIELYWQSCYFKDIEGVKVRFFSNEILFVYLCMLIFKETRRNKRFQYVVDLFFFIKKYKNDFNYSYLANIINNSKLNGYILMALDAIRDGFGNSFYLNVRFINDIRIPAFRINLLSWGVRKWWASFENPKPLIQGYVIAVIALSKGYLSQIIYKIYFLYKLNYSFFLKKNKKRHSVLTRGVHFLAMLKKLSATNPAKKGIRPEQ